jgi:ATP-dependent DNA helicase RecQ
VGETNKLKSIALQLLKRSVGQDAVFRPDQWEAIDSLLFKKKTLVVEKTGWGKSFVYFIAAKILRDQGNGITLLISPLLSLMRNQIEAAEKIGLKALTINSMNQNDWSQIEEEIFTGNCDLLLISPERLANESFRKNILNAITENNGIGMLVVDEAHCISDWGHDFRPDYRRIVRIVENLPANIPLLATTATANDRVINDIKEQIGDDLFIIRGPLIRESLKIQVIKIADQAERLAWLYENINKMPGSGIIYCLTKNDCNRVAKWLRSKGVNALEYHTDLSSNGTEQKLLEEEREAMLMNNDIKVLVATVKIGMGFDKPDIGFVIHYQRPGSLVAYYQQIGRAGRKLETAYVILLNGEEDDAIQEYFIESAFPGDEEIQKVLNIIEESVYGVSKNELYKKLNMRIRRIDNCLKVLEIDRVISKENSTYTRTPIKWTPDMQRCERVTEQRYHELRKMKEFVNLTTCYMRLISEELDAPDKHNCNRCSNCERAKFFDDSVQDANVIEAVNYLRGGYIELTPRKQWPAGIIDETKKAIPPEHQNEEGRILCSYGDAGWGKYVKEDKYKNGYFRDELVDAAADLIKYKWEKESEPTWATSVPSLRNPELVKNFTRRLSEKLGIPYIEAIIKNHETSPQKQMENSYQQAKNVEKAFTVQNIKANEPVLLVDDVVDSKWTMTICGKELRSNGAGEVYPFALASAVEGVIE